MSSSDSDSSATSSSSQSSRTSGSSTSSSQTSGSSRTSGSTSSSASSRSSRSSRSSVSSSTRGSSKISGDNSKISNASSAPEFSKKKPIVKEEDLTSGTDSGKEFTKPSNRNKEEEESEAEERVFRKPSFSGPSKEEESSSESSSDSSSSTGSSSSSRTTTSSRSESSINSSAASSKIMTDMSSRVRPSSQQIEMSEIQKLGLLRHGSEIIQARPSPKNKPKEEDVTSDDDSTGSSSDTSTGSSTSSRSSKSSLSTGSSSSRGSKSSSSRSSRSSKSSQSSKSSKSQTTDSSDTHTTSSESEEESDSDDPKSRSNITHNTRESNNSGSRKTFNRYEDEILAENTSPFLEAPYSPLKEWYSDLPEPPIVNRIAEPANEYLRNLQTNITQLRHHVRKIQEEEIQEMKNFTDSLKKNDLTEEESVTARINFTEKLGRLRYARKKFKATLFDTVQQRNGFLESFSIDKELELEKDDRMESITEPKGVDFYLFSILFFAAIVIILHVVFFDYAPIGALGTTSMNKIWVTMNSYEYSINTYSSYIGIAFMVFLGFGFHYAQLRKFAFSAIGQTFFLASFAVIWGILVNGLLNYINLDKMQKQYLDVTNLVDGLYAAAAVVVSLGVVLGRANFRQVTVMMIIEVMVYGVNHWLAKYKFFSLDTGMAAQVHVFGALFGMMANAVVFGFKSESEHHHDDTTRYNGNIFSFIGTLVLWVFFPYFNAVFGPAYTQHLIVINTVLAMLCSTCAAFALTKLFGGRFTVETVRISALAGGIIMGSPINILAHEWVSMIFGLVSGLIVFIGVKFVSPFFHKTIGWKDTMVVGWLHGFNGFLSVCFSMVATRLAENALKNDGSSIWGVNYDIVFKAHPINQGTHQFYTLLVSVGLGIFGGLLAGVFMKILPGIRSLKHESDYSDSREWRVPEDFPVQRTRDT